MSVLYQSSENTYSVKSKIKLITINIYYYILEFYLYKQTLFQHQYRSKQISVNYFREVWY